METLADSSEDTVGILHSHNTRCFAERHCNEASLLQDTDQAKAQGEIR